MLSEPYWLLRVARQLGQEVITPAQYQDILNLRTDSAGKRENNETAAIRQEWSDGFSDRTGLHGDV
jgi:hypothetical protein